MKARAYYSAIQAIILAAPHIIRSEITFDEITDSECYIQGRLVVMGGMELHLAEYVLTHPEINRLKYRYHFQTAKGELLVRWDNAPHHPEIKSYPYHLHTGDAVKESVAMDIESVLFAIVEFM